MRLVIYRILVCFFVASFVFSGAAWAACIDLPVTPASGSTSFIGHDHIGGHSGRHHPTNEENAGSSDQGPATHGHGVAVKCCSMAPIFSLAPGLLTRAVEFPRVDVSFRFAQREMVGHIVALEPGIPKFIV
jgi:hypothetical protein